MSNFYVTYFLHCFPSSKEIQDSFSAVKTEFSKHTLLDRRFVTKTDHPTEPASFPIPDRTFRCSSLLIRQAAYELTLHPQLASAGVQIPLLYPRLSLGREEMMARSQPVVKQWLGPTKYVLLQNSKSKIFFSKICISQSPPPNNNNNDNN